jgi:heme exporter protein D
MSEFLNMGGYAIYVWPSYGLATLVLWLNWYLPKRHHQQLLHQSIRRNKDRNNETRA